MTFSVEITYPAPINDQLDELLEAMAEHLGGK